MEPRREPDASNHEHPVDESPLTDESAVTKVGRHATPEEPLTVRSEGAQIDPRRGRPTPLENGHTRARRLECMARRAFPSG